MCWHRTVGRLRVETGCVCFLPFLVDRLEEEIEREEEEEEVEEVDVVLTDPTSFLLSWFLVRFHKNVFLKTLFKCKLVSQSKSFFLKKTNIFQKNAF